MVDINLKGTFLMINAVAPHMRARRYGKIVNLSSICGFMGFKGYALYCATKGAILGLTRSWAREFAPHILVNSVAPGPIDTPMLDMKNMSEAWRQKETDNPLGRIGKPEEIASVIAFLAGPEATFITGQTFGPNGGSVMI